MRDGRRVRAGCEEDLDPVMVLERGTPEAPHWTRSEYAAIFDAVSPGIDIRRQMFVASREGEILGFAVGVVWGGEGDRGELESVVVAASERRQGLGRLLCGMVLDWCRGLGARDVELEVRAASEGATALYRSLGFVSVGLRRRYYTHPGDDALLMRVRL